MKITEYTYGNISTIIEDKEDSLFLNNILGLPCGYDEGLGMDVRHLFSIRTTEKIFEQDDFIISHKSLSNNSLGFKLISKDTSLTIESIWEFSLTTGIWHRKDKIVNSSNKSITITKCLSRIIFSSGDYCLYSQDSTWCSENQGKWQRLGNENIILSNIGGRSAQGNTPYCCLHKKDSNTGIAVHIMPMGNWIIKVNSVPMTSRAPARIIETGLSDKDLAMVLPAGAEIELPAIIYQHIPEGKPSLGSQKFHQFLLDNCCPKNKKTPPVVYNCWFDMFDKLDISRLETQLNAAKEIGCEVFTVDAGWYGGDGDNWALLVGDWNEKKGLGLAAFAEKVRKEGLQFGIWMEPERIGASLEVVKENLDWFCLGSGGFYYPDITQPVVYDYIYSQISQVIERYKAQWLKLDFNFDLINDKYNSEFYLYYKNWFSILDKLQNNYPKVFFEGCSSGGLRSDIKSICRFDGYFVSDNVNPMEALQIQFSGLLRLPAGRLTRWVSVRAINDIPKYTATGIHNEEAVIVPSGNGATWNDFENVDIDFAAKSAMVGLMGFSGDIASLSDSLRKRLQAYTDFYKKHRNFIANSTAHLLTEPVCKQKKTDWLAVQLNSNTDEKTIMLFVYRLLGDISKKSINLKGLKQEQLYEVKQFGNEALIGSYSGKQLMEEGIKIELASQKSAEVFIVCPV